MLSVGAPDNVSAGTLQQKLLWAARVISEFRHHHAGARADTEDLHMDPVPAAAWACQNAARGHARAGLAAAQRQPIAHSTATEIPGQRDMVSANTFRAVLWQTLGQTTLSVTMASQQLSACGVDAQRHDTVRNEPHNILVYAG